MSDDPTEVVRTRSADGEIKGFLTIAEAFKYAKTFSKVWRISWICKLVNGNEEIVHFVRRGHPDSNVWEFTASE